MDDYISAFPKDVQGILERIRRTIRESAPEAEETISYQIPTFRFQGNLVHFAAFKGHVEFYPTPSAIERFEKELARYERAKGVVRFPVDKPIPYDLIGKIVRHRVRENLKKGRKQ